MNYIKQDTARQELFNRQTVGKGLHDILYLWLLKYYSVVEIRLYIYYGVPKQLFYANAKVIFVWKNIFQN